MLWVGYLLFGITAAMVIVLPLIAAIYSGEWTWLFAIIPAWIVRQVLHVLSGYCKAKWIEQHGGPDIESQVRDYREGRY